MRLDAGSKGAAGIGTQLHSGPQANVAFPATGAPLHHASRKYGPEQIADALAHLARADYLTGHSIQKYDLPLLRRLYDWAPSARTKIIDTLVASRLILPNLSDLDDQVAAMGGGA